MNNHTGGSSRTTVTGFHSMNAIRILMLLLLIGSIFVPPHRVTKAQTNVCAELAREIFVPYETCVEVDARCFFYPHCCLPGACFTSPDCKLWAIVEQVRRVQPGELYCDFSPDDFVDQMLKGNIANLADLVAGGLPRLILAAYDSHTQYLASQGHPFPEPVKEVLRDLIAPLYDYGQTGYSYGDIENISILSERVPGAYPYLHRGEGASAVTIGPAIIFSNPIYDQLTGASYTLEEIQKGYAPDDYAQAIEVAVHELVHVAQFRRYGSDIFGTNYVLDYLAGGAEGYERSIYEDEAFGFSARQSMHHGGWYCQDNLAGHRMYVDQRDLYIPSVWGTCKPLHYGDQPVGRCALPVQWQGTTLEPLQHGGHCLIDTILYSQSPSVWRHSFYIAADETIPGYCKQGVYDGANCFVGTAPNGTRASMWSDDWNLWFVYDEIGVANSIPSQPAPECEDGDEKTEFCQVHRYDGEQEYICVDGDWTEVGRCKISLIEREDWLRLYRQLLTPDPR